MTVLRDKLVKARKRHKCFVCGLSIWPGETYRHSGNVYDGSAYTIKEHPECARTGARYHDSFCEDGYTGESTEEGLRGAYFDLLRRTYLVGDMTDDERITFMRMHRASVLREAQYLLAR